MLYECDKSRSVAQPSNGTKSRRTEGREGGFDRCGETVAINWLRVLGQQDDVGTTRRAGSCSGTNKEPPRRLFTLPKPSQTGCEVEGLGLSVWRLRETQTELGVMGLARLIGCVDSSQTTGECEWWFSASSLEPARATQRSRQDRAQSDWNWTGGITTRTNAPLSRRFATNFMILFFRSVKRRKGAHKRATASSVQYPPSNVKMGAVSGNGWASVGKASSKKGVAEPPLFSLVSAQLCQLRATPASISPKEG